MFHDYLVVKNNLEKYEFVNGKDDLPYMKWKIIQMFETTNQCNLMRKKRLRNQQVLGDPIFGQADDIDDRYYSISQTCKNCLA
jgi:hypothetical protein